MVIGIIIGVIVGALFWHTEITGALFGGIVGWAIWRIMNLEAKINKIQAAMNGEETTPVLKEHVSKTAEYSNLIDEPQTQAISIAQASESIKEKHNDESSTAPDKSWGLSDEENNTLPHQNPEWMQPIEQATERLVAALSWFINGNMLVKVGSIVLFFGTGFLLKYASEHSHLPIEFRMLGIFIGALAMLVVGWRLRHTRPGYGLALQGGGLGLLYLTVFASFRLYALLDPMLAMVLLAVIAFAGVSLSLAFNARWLAILSFAGGFLAPILVSTGSGNHVALFSWYAVLNIGIALLAWKKAWRSLNLLGMLATFIIAALWGNKYYTAAFFDSVEPFLVGFGLLYLAIGVVFSLHRADPEQEEFGRVDASIIFGTPVGFFLLQTPLVHHFEHGMSLSALIAGLCYLAIAFVAYKKDNINLLVALLSIGVALLTLTIPFEFDELETAGAWAIEGVGLLWIGLAQNSQRAVFTGIALQLLAAGCWLLGSPISPDASYGSTLSAFLIAFSGWACAKQLTQNQPFESTYPASMKNLGFHFQVWGLMWWILAGLVELNRHYHDNDMLLSAILWLTGAAWLNVLLEKKLNWVRLAALNQGLVALWLGALFLQAFWIEHPAQSWGLLAWLPAFATMCWMLYQADKRAELEDNTDKTKTFNTFHVLTVLFALAFFTWELSWLVDEWLSKPKNMPIGTALVPGIVAALILMVFSSNAHLWPVSKHKASYLHAGAIICLFIMGAWFIKMLPNSVSTSLPYIPLLNILDIAIAIVFLSMFTWWKALKTNDMLWFSPFTLYLVCGVTLFVALNLDLARFVHHWLDIPWEGSALMHSEELQAAFSICWSLLALLLMSFASKRHYRILWITGAVLLALVVLKLFAVDMSGIGTLARIVSFLGVGGLLLVIGYLSPIPLESKAVETPETTLIDLEFKE